MVSMIRFVLSLLCLTGPVALWTLSGAAPVLNEFRPLDLWQDTDGNLIQAHGGGILLHDGAYYWYGEDRTPGIHSAVSCYFSTNLLDWVDVTSGVLTNQTLQFMDDATQFGQRFYRGSTQ